MTSENVYFWLPTGFLAEMENLINRKSDFGQTLDPLGGRATPLWPLKISFLNLAAIMNFGRIEECCLCQNLLEIEQFWSNF